MFGGISYIVRLMRGVETQLEIEHEFVLQSVVAKITDRLASEHNAFEALQTLARVAQFENFTITLMWSLHRWTVFGGEVSAEVVAHDVSRIRNSLVAAMRKSPPRTITQFTIPAQSTALRMFLVRLQECGHQIDLLRDSMNGGAVKELPQQKLFAVIESATRLRESALRFGRQDVIRFTIVLLNFLKYVLHNKLVTDVRVLNILDSARHTLESVMDPQTSGVVLTDAAELLENPETLLDYTA